MRVDTARTHVLFGLWRLGDPDLCHGVDGGFAGGCDAIDAHSRAALFEQGERVTTNAGMSQRRRPTRTNEW